MRSEEVIFTLPFGSRLYGTAGPESDFDYKIIYKPKLLDLISAHPLTNFKQRESGPQDTVKPGEEECEYIPLHNFLDDYYAGQTYALELAWAIIQLPADCPNWVFALINTLVKNFTTSSVEKMVGYAITQSRTYGLKTQRLKTLNDVMALIGAEDSVLNKQRLYQVPALLEALYRLDHVTQTAVKNAKGGAALAPALDICGKKFPLTTTWATIIESVQRTLGNYGDRVKQFEDAGADWKALSHAIRITEQVLELSQTGELQFPRPNAKYLRAVKLGEISLKDAEAYLTECFNQIDEAIAVSVLPTRTPELTAQYKKFRLETLKRFYNL